MLKEVFTLLTERQILVLKAIVEEFIQTAQPVGSRILSKKEELNFSAATIRNDMADLEDLGFIEKTHTSSGRVPSQKGYRYYVDFIVNQEPMETTPEVGIFRQLLDQKQFERETTIKEAVKLLSSLTNYTSILLGPSRDYSRVKKIQLVPISERQAVFVLITDQGHVESRTITLPTNIDMTRMESIIKALDELLVGEYIGHVHEKLTESFEHQLHDFISYKDERLYVIEDSIYDGKPRVRLTCYDADGNSYTKKLDVDWLSDFSYPEVYFENLEMPGYSNMIFSIRYDMYRGREMQLSNFWIKEH